MFSQTPFHYGHVDWVRPQPQLGALAFFCASTQSQSHYCIYTPPAMAKQQISTKTSIPGDSKWPF